MAKKRMSGYGLDGGAKVKVALGLSKSAPDSPTWKQRVGWPERWGYGEGI